MDIQEDISWSTIARQQRIIFAWHAFVRSTCRSRAFETKNKSTKIAAITFSTSIMNTGIYIKAWLPIHIPISKMRFTFILWCLSITAVIPWSLAANVQKPGLTVPAEYASNKQAVITMFTETYEQYKCVILLLSFSLLLSLSYHSIWRKFAFGHDDLQPVSETFNDGRNGWGATIVDALDTMVLWNILFFFISLFNPFNYSFLWALRYVN